jgi:hypothetical protein
MIRQWQLGIAIPGKGNDGLISSSENCGLVRGSNVLMAIHGIDAEDHRGRSRLIIALRAQLTHHSM